MVRSLAAALAFVLFVPAAGACVLHLRQSAPTWLTWDAIDGVSSYEVSESLDNFVTSRNYFIAGNHFVIARRASADTRAQYMVTALFSSNIESIGPATDVCTEKVTATIPADPQFRALTGRVILPITGSTAGAFGGRFKTSLKLTYSVSGQRGRIVFHPVGTVASATDPSIRYAYETGPYQFDDVVGQLGASGIGTLEIIPDTDGPPLVPSIDARLYNDTPSGTFGTAAPPVYPFEYLEAPRTIVDVPAGDFRVNFGIRTLTATTAKVLIYDTNGRLRTFGDLSWPADYTAFGTLQQITGKSVAPGEKVEFDFNGSAIPFYTVTENRTNDPQLFIGVPEHSLNVGAYVE